MDPSAWYAIGLAAIVACAAILFLILPVLIRVWVCILAFSLRHGSYYRFPWRVSGGTNGMEIVLVLIFIATNVLAITWQLQTVPSFVKRTGELAVVNLIALSFGRRIGFITHHLKVKPSQLEQIHCWVGITMIIEGLTHAIAGISWKCLHGQAITAIEISITAVIAAIGVTSVPYFRQRFYEIFLHAHILFSMFLITALWIHITPTSPFQIPRLYLLLATGLWGLNIILRMACLLYRNIPHNNAFNEATVISFPGAIHLCVKVTRPWKFRPGQFVYLTVPRSSRTGLVQSHPFFVARWYKSPDDHDKETAELQPDTIVLIAKIRGGFTRSLDKIAQKALLSNGCDQLKEKWPQPCWCSHVEKSARVPVLIEGPYGQEMDLSSFGTVLIFASGIGIAGQLPYLTRLLDLGWKWNTRTKRICLFWEIESELHALWVKDWMTEYLSLDMNKNILDLHIFVLGDYMSKETPQGASGNRGDRIRVKYGPLDVRATLSDEWRNRKGSVAVCTCSRKEISYQIRDFLARNMDRRTRLFQLWSEP